MLHGDADVTNSVAPHPHFPVLATSGIEDHVKLWEPKLPVGTGPLMQPTDVHGVVYRSQEAMKQRQPTQDELMEVGCVIFVSGLGICSKGLGPWAGL